MQDIWISLLSSLRHPLVLRSGPSTEKCTCASSLPNGWSGSGSGTSYIQLTASSNYIQTSDFSTSGITSVKIKARTYGGPSNDQAKITVSWIVGSTETILGTITPSNTTLTDYPIDANIPSVSGMGHIKIACKGASSSKGSGVSQVTITYNEGSTPSGPSIVCSNISDVPYEGVTNATTTATFNNADGWTPSITCDETVVTSASINGNTITYSVSKNTGNIDREGWFKITLSKEGETSIEKKVTVSQKHFAVDYVTLPFQWIGGTKTELTELDGVTAEGLGSDYADGNAPYYIKFDDTGDYIQVKTNEPIGIISIGVKMIGGATASSITVKGSTDGTDFTDVETLSISGNQNTVVNLSTSNSLDVDYRYARFVFNKGSNVGVGPITIAKAAVAHNLSSAISPANAGTVELGKTSIEEGQKTTAKATPNEGYRFNSWSITGTGALLSSETENPTTITMGSEDATITANFEARTPATITWHHGQNGEQTKQVNTYADATIGTLETADEVNGWTFRGWSRSSSIEGIPVFVTTSDVVGGNIDLYAVYSQGDNLFELTTSTDDLEVDAKYLIGSYDNGYYMMVFDSNFKKASSKTTLNGENQFTYSNGEILTLGGETDNWTFMTSDGKYFSSQTTSSSNASLKKEDSATDYSYWSISYDSSSPKHAVIKNNGNATNNDKNINVSYYNGNFNVYGNEVVYLFKQIETPTYSTTPTADVSVTITYVVDGVSTEERFDDGNAAVKSEQPSKTGYDFKAWNTKEDGSGTTYVAGQEVNENLTLYAIWTIKSFSYTLNITGPDAEALASLYVDETEIAEDAKINYNTEVTVVVAVSDGYMYSISVKDANENPVDVTNGTFIMPASDVTVTVTTQVDMYVHDELTSGDFTATSTTYQNFSGVSKSSYAVYAGNSAKSKSGGIQLRTNNSNSGIVTTTSGGFVRSITVKFESETTKRLDVYGKNTPYTAASDLYDNSNGTKIAEVDGDGTYTITGDYTYIGIRSNNGARYVTSITIDWEPFKTKDVEITAAKYATLGLPYAVTIPEGVSAYTLNPQPKYLVN